MKTGTPFALAPLVLGTDAINLLKRAEPRVVQHAIQRKHVTDPIQRDRNRMRRRDNTLSLTLDNEETLYFANVSIGTPAQDFRLHIDTGSSDTWVNVASSALCSGRGKYCASSGVYSPNDSSTYTYVNSDFNISYADGSGSSGDYATDTVTIGSATLKNQRFGIGYTSSTEEGILGIGYDANEASVQLDAGRTYSNVPHSLLNDGYVSSNAYSLWLNDLDASTGSILFGGVNAGKYTGSLETVPIIQVYGEYAEFIIALTAIGANGTTGSIASDQSIAALLDSGSSLMYLPDDITQSIYDAVGATYDASQGAAFVDCNLANSAGTLDFTFSSPTIQVAMNELVIEAGVDRGQPVCILGIGPAGSSMPVLGDTFLRSAYVVYDLTANEISLAQTDFNSTTDDIREIANSTGVPDATLVASAVTSVAVATGGARLGGTVTVEGFAAPTAARRWDVVAAAAAAAGAVLAL